MLVRDNQWRSFMGVTYKSARQQREADLLTTSLNEP